MPRFDPERLTTLALLTLEDAAAQGGDGIVCRTWGIRLALAWLHGARMATRESCDEFWRLLVDLECHQSTEAGANVYRSAHLGRELEVIYRSAGVQRTPCMIYVGSAGKKPKRTRIGDKVDERVRDLTDL